MGLGTYFGGWRIVKTLGMKLTKLQPVGGFCAETEAALPSFSFLSWVFLSAQRTRSPARLWRRFDTAAIRSPLGVARSIMWAWVLTIPCSAFLGAMLKYFARLAASEVTKIFQIPDIRRSDFKFTHSLTCPLNSKIWNLESGIGCLFCGLGRKAGQSMLKTGVPLLIFVDGQSAGPKGFLQPNQSFAGQRRGFLG